MARLDQLFERIDDSVPLTTLVGVVGGLLLGVILYVSEGGSLRLCLAAGIAAGFVAARVRRAKGRKNREEKRLRAQARELAERVLPGSDELLHDSAAIPSDDLSGHDHAQSHAQPLDETSHPSDDAPPPRNSPFQDPSGFPTPQLHS